MGIEQLNDLGEISERAGEPIDLVDQHNVDRPRPDIGQELPHGRTLERGAGECTIVVTVRDQAPAFVRLTLYVCLAGLALGIERGKGKVEVVLGGLPGIDGATQELADLSVHGRLSITEGIITGGVWPDHAQEAGLGRW